MGNQEIKFEKIINGKRIEVPSKEFFELKQVIVQNARLLFGGWVDDITFDGIDKNSKMGRTFGNNPFCEEYRKIKDFEERYNFLQKVIIAYDYAKKIEGAINTIIEKIWCAKNTLIDTPKGEIKELNYNLNLILFKVGLHYENVVFFYHLFEFYRLNVSAIRETLENEQNAPHGQTLSDVLQTEKAKQVLAVAVAGGLLNEDWTLTDKMKGQTKRLWALLAETLSCEIAPSKKPMYKMFSSIWGYSGNFSKIRSECKELRGCEIGEEIIFEVFPQKKVIR